MAVGGCTVKLYINIEEVVAMLSVGRTASAASLSMNFQAYVYLNVLESG
jgi:hypothetical protein